MELPPYGSGREAFEAFKKEVEQRKREHPGYSPPPYENALKVIKHGRGFHEGVVLSYDGYMVTAQGELISKLSSVSDPRLSDFLDRLAQDTPQVQEEVHWAINAARNTERADKLRALREAAYVKRLEALGLTEEVNPSVMVGD